ncbi:MAG TPA: SH3 domain-containing protein [Rhodospirillales bacterium]|jgi:SH3-like domain-containing protein|nr:SH3 domain-containing protein [Rhodospirillales bacterium]
MSLTRSGFLVLACAFFLATTASALAVAEGSGLPLPRFVSLRAKEVNMRAGPGVQYPVEWVYHRQKLPVEIIAEYNTWRKVRDWQGTQGWIHQSMLGGRRFIIVTGTKRTVRRQAAAKSAPVAQAETGVIGKLVRCPESGNWCEIEIGNHKGWLRKVDFWGVYRDEVVE